MYKNDMIMSIGDGDETRTLKAVTGKYCPRTHLLKFETGFRQSHCIRGHTLQAFLGTKNASKRCDNGLSQTDVLEGVFAHENPTRSCINT